MMFSLQPFPSDKSLPNLSIAGDIARNSNTILLRYEVIGDLKEIAFAKRAVRHIAPPSNAPARQHQLWESTCFEFFIGIENSEEYWEFNLSPAGHWNVYHFDAYRQGMQEELAFITLPFIFKNQADRLTLDLTVDLDKIVAEAQPIEVAITTVIKLINGEVSYWALTHRDESANFHVRESFSIKL